MQVPSGASNEVNMRAFLPFLGFVFVLIVNLALFAYRRVRQRRCQHYERAMDPTGRWLCLKCLKRNY